MKLKTKTIAIATLFTLILVVSTFAWTFAQPTPQRGPQIDVVRFKVVKSPDSVLFEMMTTDPATGLTGLDIATDLIRPADIETMASAGRTITTVPGFHMGFIRFNVRPDQTYRPGGASEENLLKGKVLSDVNFRYALFQCYDQDTIVASIYKYTVTPVKSMVPPAQGGWRNPGIVKPPYNPGNPITSTPGDGSACGVLKAAGYTYVGGEWKTPTAWGDEGDKPIPDLKVFTPTYETAPTSAEHGARFTTDCQNIGLPIVHEPMDFESYLELVYGEANFDLFMVFYGLARFPDHLYDMCHSSQDCQLVPWAYNAPGLHSDDLDDLVETIKFSLDHDEKVAAAWAAQEMLYDISYPECAFSTMMLYSRMYFNAHMNELTGVVNSPGYGSDNSWTYLNMRWTPGSDYERIEGTDDHVVIWQCGEEPESFNPCFAHTVYAWLIIAPALDGLMAVNPYTHQDMPWIATSWDTDQLPANYPVTLDSDNRYYEVDKDETYVIEEGMKVTYHLRNDVEWHDGNIYKASDAEFNLEFLRDNEIPRYMSTWEHIVDVQCPDDTTVIVYSNVTSQWLLYDFAGDAALMPPPVWSWLDGKPLQDILAYDPEGNLTTPTGAGPRFGTEWCPTQVYGTGPFIYTYYDPVAMYIDMPANRYYFLETGEIEALKATMFHSIGDVDNNGEVWGNDKTRYSLSYAYSSGEVPPYDVDADISGPEGVPDDMVDAWDGVLINFFWTDKKEYP